MFSEIKFKDTIFTVSLRKGCYFGREKADRIAIIPKISGIVLR